MKLLAALIILVVGSSALPQEPAAERNIITDQIVIAIEDISENIKDAGLDPLYINREAGSYALPVPVIFNAAGFCEEVLFTGLSDIVINRINYSVLGFSLTFDIELPHVHLSADAAYGEVVLFDNKLYGEASGSFDIYSLQVKGTVRVGVLGGIGVRDISIDLSLGTIDSKVNAAIQGIDLSDYVNMFLNEIVPNTHQNFKREIDELIEIIALNIINENLL